MHNNNTMNKETEREKMQPNTHAEVDVELFYYVKKRYFNCT